MNIIDYYLHNKKQIDIKYSDQYVELGKDFDRLSLSFYKNAGKLFEKYEIQHSDLDALFDKIDEC